VFKGIFFQTKHGKYVLAFAGTICNPDNPDVKNNQILVKKHVFNICMMPSKDLKETADILWQRHPDGRRFTVESIDKFYLYLEKRLPGYMPVADTIILTYNSSIERVIDAVFSIINK